MQPGFLHSLSEIKVRATPTSQQLMHRKPRPQTQIYIINTEEKISFIATLSVT